MLRAQLLGRKGSCWPGESLERSLDLLQLLVRRKGSLERLLPGVLASADLPGRACTFGAVGRDGEP